MQTKSLTVTHHSRAMRSLSLPCQDPTVLLEKGQREAVEIIKVRRELLNLYTFSSSRMNVGEGVDESL